MQLRKIYNPIIGWLLRTPLHGLMSESVMLITFTGRKSGKTYTTPVNYSQDGDVLTIVSFRRRTWWRNLRDGAPISVRLRGQDLAATGHVIEDDAGVTEALVAYLQRMPRYARYFQVALDPDGQPNPEDVARAARDRVMVRVTLA